MIKLIVTPNDINDLDWLLISVDAILFGIKDMSVNYVEISVDNLNEVVNKIKLAGKEVFISLNKNMHNKDLALLEELLIKCDELHINGIFYYDVAVLQICHRLSLALPLIWSAEHLVTNFYTIQKL